MRGGKSGDEAAASRHPIRRRVEDVWGRRAWRTGAVLAAFVGHAAADALHVMRVVLQAEVVHSSGGRHEERDAQRVLVVDVLRVAHLRAEEGAAMGPVTAVTARSIAVGSPRQ